MESEEGIEELLWEDWSEGLLREDWSEGLRREAWRLGLLSEDCRDGLLRELCIGEVSPVGTKKEETPPLPTEPPHAPGSAPRAGPGWGSPSAPGGMEGDGGDQNDGDRDGDTHRHTHTPREQGRWRQHGMLQLGTCGVPGHDRDLPMPSDPRSAPPPRSWAGSARRGRAVLWDAGPGGSLL